jgi:hypothetical protein
MQYRDIFDNHPPLFHILMAPLFRLFPERADIVAPMRLFMIPLYVASMAAVYRIGCVLFSGPVAVWLALIAGALPAFFLPGTEFRPDDLYAALWLWALVVAVEGPFTIARAAKMGLFLGACAGITMKTSLVFSAMSLAAGIAVALRWRFAGARPSAAKLLVRVIAFGLAGLAVPGALCIYFAAHHALGDLCFYVLRYNVVPRAERWGGSALHYFYLPIAAPFVIAGAIWIYKRSPDQEIAARRVFFALLPALYYLLLYSYWPDITAQDNLPAAPLVPLAVAALILPSYGKSPSCVCTVALPAVLVVCLAMIWRTQVLQRGSIDKYVEPIATVLALTTPDEYVMDLKGDAIYRPRPFYYGIETFAKLRMKLGWIKNDIVERLIETRTSVCFHPPFPGSDVVKFVNANYLPIENCPNVLVLGQVLPVASGSPIRFTVTIPAEYVLLDRNRPASGALDGHPYGAEQYLGAGEHQFLPAGAGPLTLYWARAWNHGYQPGTELKN